MKVQDHELVKKVLKGLTEAKPVHWRLHGEEVDWDELQVQVKSDTSNDDVVKPLPRKTLYKSDPIGIATKQGEMPGGYALVSQQTIYEATALLAGMREDPEWQQLRDLFGFDGWYDGKWQGVATPAQIVTHVQHVSQERARLLFESMRPKDKPVHPCDNGCQYAKDVGMPEYSCGRGCMYESHPDYKDQVMVEDTKPRPGAGFNSATSDIYGPDMPIDPKTFRGYLQFLKSDWLRWIGVLWLILLTPLMLYRGQWGMTLIAAVATVWLVWYSWACAYQHELYMAAKKRAFAKAYPNYEGLL